MNEYSNRCPPCLERLLVVLLSGANAAGVETVNLEVLLLLRAERVLAAAAGGALVILGEVVEVRAAVDVTAVAAHHRHSGGLEEKEEGKPRG